ncbi:DUF6291 domain-containing protein [Leeuwenhoekiella aequorea]|uniref:DUF6291 domain-containing protein n=1 Tax=Leeuwenhoekiella aequorea TaxID=283736 RepID=UPI00352C5A36|tara:strand:+ start:7935 stop:8408 length:474 start_codon:yes stop_codon:yes gene_type:complete
MAEGKKSFMLYKSWLFEINKLSNEQAGILFKNILKYVNNESLSTGMESEATSLFIKMKEQIEFEWSKFNPKSGKYHWNYNGGITDENKSIRSSTAYKIWRSDVFSKDEYTCQSCGVFGGVLNAHHIKPFAKYPKLRTELSNGITLCVDCHKKEHSNG